MRKLWLGLTVVAALAVPAWAQEAPSGGASAASNVKGLYLIADYPALSVRPGATATISLRLQNFNLPPERLALSVGGVPQGWTATLMGGGQPVAAAMPTTNGTTTLELRVDVPRDAATGTQTLTVAAEGPTSKLSLPVALTLARDLPAKLSLQPQLPELRGTARANFEYQVTIKNESGKRLTVSLAAQAPPNFETSFTEAYGTQELNAVPIDAGQSKDVKLKVRPPTSAAAGRSTITMRATAEDAVATTDVALEIVGQPKLDISGRDGLVSGRAVAGQESRIPVLILNSGTAPADNVEISGTAPGGWKISFDPKTIDRLAPNENKEVQAIVTPVDKAIAGDYVTTIRAASRGETASSTFRISVTTSTMWGIVGAGIVGIALLVMVGAVARFGRR